jgi:hypothetical protein
MRPEDRMPEPVASNSQVFSARDEGGFTDYRRFTSADATTANPADEKTVAAQNNFFGEDGLTLGDVIDIINPLQHIPVVASVYRYVTGDEISPGAQLAGGSLYGGPIGFAGSLANVIMKDQTGDDLGGTALTAMFGNSETTGTGTALAEAAAESAPVQTPPVQTAQVDAESLNDIQPSAAQSGVSPLFAAQPQVNAAGQRSSPFAAMPVGSPIASVQPILPGQPTVTSGSNPQTPPGTAAAQGVPNLSADAATALMRMAQNSQAQSGPTQNSALADAAPTQAMAPMEPPTKPGAEPKFFSLDKARVAPTPLASHSGITAPPSAPKDAPSTQAAPTVVAEAASDDPNSPDYIEPVASKDLPSAMMDALAKYEKMKSPS